MYAPVYERVSVNKIKAMRLNRLSSDFRPKAVQTLR